MKSSIPLPQPGDSWPLGTHYVCVPTLQDARRLFNTADFAARERKSAVYYRGLEVRQRILQGIHDRCEEYAYANGPLPSQQDLDGLAKHLPLHFKVIRLEKYRVKKGDIWDLTTAKDDYWPELDHLEELYVHVIIDHLILEEKARIAMRGNVFSMECGVLERASSAPCETMIGAQCHDIGIFPTPFSVDRNASGNTGEDGEDGRPGLPGADGDTVTVQGSVFGPRLVESPDDVDTDGKPGTSGSDGTNGRRGRNGGMCRLADIRIGKLVGFDRVPLRVYSQAGTGEPGGNGGKGGAGGDGGRGGDGARTINAHVPAGRGGDGGDGGHGGNGANGGNGGISSNVFLQLSPEDCMYVLAVSHPSAGGEAGQGGTGGKAGQGGAAGRAVEPVDQPRNGVHGKPGKDGRNGKPGKERPGAHIFVIPAGELQGSAESASHSSEAHSAAGSLLRPT